MITRRVRRPKAQEIQYKELTDKKEFGIFETYKDVFMAAGVIGYIEGKKMAFKDTAEGMAWSVFNLETDLTIINAVAICDTKDLNILLDNEENFDLKLKIFEEYAAGGLPILYNKIMDNKKYASQNYFSLIMDMERQKSEIERSREDILNNFNILEFD